VRARPRVVLAAERGDAERNLAAAVDRRARYLIGLRVERRASCCACARARSAPSERSSARPFALPRRRRPATYRVPRARGRDAAARVSASSACARASTTSRCAVSTCASAPSRHRPVVGRGHERRRARGRARHARCLEAPHERSVLARDAVREPALLVRRTRGVVGVHRALARTRVVVVLLCHDGRDVRCAGVGGRAREVGSGKREHVPGGCELVGDAPKRERELGGLRRGCMQRVSRCVRSAASSVQSPVFSRSRGGARASVSVVRVPLELGRGRVRFLLCLCVSASVWEERRRRTLDFARAVRGRRARRARNYGAREQEAGGRKGKGFKGCSLTTSELHTVRMIRISAKSTDIYPWIDPIRGFGTDGSRIHP
jgi:hypothetical protein